MPPKQHCHPHADGADDQRSGHADRERLQPNTFEHREVRIQSDCGHGGAKQDL